MSRQNQQNKSRSEKLMQKFDTEGYPEEYPWAMEFLCKVKVNDGRVATPSQQDTLDTLWDSYGSASHRG